MNSSNAGSSNQEVSGPCPDTAVISLSSLIYLKHVDLRIPNVTNGYITLFFELNLDPQTLKRVINPD